LGEGLAAFLHLRQSRRINLWAMAKFKDDGNKKGSMPISTNLGITPTALLVWRVERSKCPVRAACTAKLAVSESLISPTKIISGSCRRIDLSPLAKV